MSLPYDWPGKWTKTAPKVEDHRDGCELVWAVRGHPFARTLVARSNIAVRISEPDGKARRFVRVELMADGFNGRDIREFRWFAALEWRGPLALPESYRPCPSRIGPREGE